MDEAGAHKALARAVFNAVAADYDAEGVGIFAHFGRRLVAAAGVAPGERVLDVATGRGAVLVPAAEWHCQGNFPASLAAGYAILAA